MYIGIFVAVFTKYTTGLYAESPCQNLHTRLAPVVYFPHLFMSSLPNDLLPLIIRPHVLFLSAVLIVISLTRLVCLTQVGFISRYLTE